MKSDTQVAIVASGVGKRFRRYRQDRAWTFQELLVGGLRGAPAEWFWGLRDVSFSVAKGRTLGIVGRNGAGKSTLLRLLGGIGRTDEGRIEVHGKVSGLLSLGAGFHGDLTGRENVFAAGVIGGATRAEIAGRFDAIVDFAEVRGFIDAPVRTYSTGMLMRLAFAVAVHVQPGILLVDEVLAVGDAAFQEKCLTRVAAMKREGAAIVVVSHDMESVRHLCDEVLWLESGRVAALGPASQVMDQYGAEMVNRTLHEETRRRTPVHQLPSRTRHGFTLVLGENRFGSQEVQILDVRVIGPAGEDTSNISSGDSVAIEIDYAAPAPVGGAIFNVVIADSQQRVWLDPASEPDHTGAGLLGGIGTVTLRLDRVNLPEGSYWIDVGAYERSWSYAYDTHEGVYPLAVHRSNVAAQPAPPLSVAMQWFDGAGDIAVRRTTRA